MAAPLPLVRALSLATAVVVSSSLWAGEALAETPDVSQPEAPSIDKLLQAGHAAMSKGDAERARASYLAAYEQQARFDTAANLGLAELELGLEQEAAQHLKLALDAFPDGGNDALRERLQAALSRAGGDRAADGGASSAPEAAGAQPSAEDYDVGGAVLVASGITLSAGAIAVGAALLAGGLARNANASEKEEARDALGLAEPCTTYATVCDEIDTNTSAGSGLVVGGIIAMASGAAVATATIIYALVATSDDEDTDDELAVAPWIDPTEGGGAVLRLRF